MCFSWEKCRDISEQLDTAFPSILLLTCVQNHLDHQGPELPEVALGHVAQDEAVIVQHGLEEGCHMVILQDRFVVVEDGEVGAGLDMEVVGGAGVVVVVDDGGEEQGEDLEVGQPVLDAGLADQPVGGLQHVAGVQVVVVRVTIPGMG